MDRPGARQVPEGSGEQEKLEETGCEIICGAPTILVVKGLMMMMAVIFSLFIVIFSLIINAFFLVSLWDPMDLWGFELPLLISLLVC